MDLRNQTKMAKRVRVEVGRGSSSQRERERSVNMSKREVGSRDEESRVVVV